MLREIDVEAPSWQEGVTRIREPRVRDFIAARKIDDEQERTVNLLGAMVLDKDGKPVGVEAILEASVAALEELATVVPRLLKREVTADPPLDQTSG
jgi:hypothetical protein